MTSSALLSPTVQPRLILSVGLQTRERATDRNSLHHGRPIAGRKNRRRIQNLGESSHHHVRKISQDNDKDYPRGYPNAFKLWKMFATCRENVPFPAFQREALGSSTSVHSDLSLDSGILASGSSDSGIDLSRSRDLSESPGITLSFSSTSPTVHSTNSSITWNCCRGVSRHVQSGSGRETFASQCGRSREQSSCCVVEWA